MSFDVCNTITEQYEDRSATKTYSPAYMDGLLYGKGIRILVDTGASLSLMNAELFDAIRSEDKNTIKILPWTRGMVRTAGGDTLRVRGIAHIIIAAGTMTMRIPVALVEKLSKGLIMGIDILEKTKATIQMDKKTITFGGTYCIPIDITTGEAMVMEEIEEDFKITPIMTLNVLSCKQIKTISYQHIAPPLSTQNSLKI